MMEQVKLFCHGAVIRCKGLFLVSSYLGAIIAANLVIARLGPAASVVNAFLFIGFDLVARDGLHEKWRGNGLRWKMTALIATGSTLSWLLNRDAGQIAAASFVAFLLSGVTDTEVYSRLYRRRLAIKINGSNIASSAVDSVVFPLLAFGWPPMVWVIIGQFTAKTLGGLMWSLILTYRPPAKLNGRQKEGALNG